MPSADPQSPAMNYIRKSKCFTDAIRFQSFKVKRNKQSILKQTYTNTQIKTHYLQIIYASFYRAFRQFFCKH